MGSIKEINIKYRKNYFFEDMNAMKDFDSNLQKIDKNSYKNIDIYYIGHITMKDSDYVNINNVNSLHLIFLLYTLKKKILTLVSTDKNK